LSPVKELFKSYVSLVYGKRFFTFLVLLISFYAQAQKQYMQLTEIVTDSADIFTPDQLTELRQKLTGFETETTNQLVVVTIKNLGFESIESYANGLFNQNGLGQEGKDNGLLILFSKMDREVRIEVGSGLEPYITDAVASRIIRNTMIPKFKEELYYVGISEGTDQLISFLNNPEALKEFKADIRQAEDKNKTIGIVFLGLFLSVFVGVGGFFFTRTYKGLVEIFRGIFIGKLGVVPGIFMSVAALVSSFFGLLFVIVPLVVAAAIYRPDFVFNEGLLESPEIGFWLLIPFMGIAMFIAFVQIKFFGKEDFKLSLLENDKTYYRKTFSSSGSHSFGSGSSSSSSS